MSHGQVCCSEQLDSNPLGYMLGNVPFIPKSLYTGETDEYPSFDCNLNGISLEHNLTGNYFYSQKSNMTIGDATLSSKYAQRSQEGVTLVDSPLQLKSWIRDIFNMKAMQREAISCIFDGLGRVLPDTRHGAYNSGNPEIKLFNSLRRVVMQQGYNTFVFGHKAGICKDSGTIFMKCSSKGYYGWILYIHYGSPLNMCPYIGWYNTDGFKFMPEKVQLADPSNYHENEIKYFYTSTCSACNGYGLPSELSTMARDVIQGMAFFQDFETIDTWTIPVLVPNDSDPNSPVFQEMVQTVRNRARDYENMVYNTGALIESVANTCMQHLTTYPHAKLLPSEDLHYHIVKILCTRRPSKILFGQGERESRIESDGTRVLAWKRGDPSFSINVDFDKCKVYRTS